MTTPMSLNKFSSLSDKTMVAIFPNVCLWRRSYAQNWETVSSHLHMPVRPMLLHRMALVSFLLFRKNLGNLRECFRQMGYRPPPRQKIARRLQLVVRIGAHARITQRLRNGSSNFSLIVFVLAVITKYPLTCAMFTSFLISYQGGCIRLR